MEDLPVWDNYWYHKQGTKGAQFYDKYYHVTFSQHAEKKHIYMQTSQSNKRTLTK